MKTTEETGSPTTVFDDKKLIGVGTKAKQCLPFLRATMEGLTQFRAAVKVIESRQRTAYRYAVLGQISAEEVAEMMSEKSGRKTTRDDVLRLVSEARAQLAKITEASDFSVRTFELLEQLFPDMWKAVAQATQLTRSVNRKN